MQKLLNAKDMKRIIIGLALVLAFSFSGVKAQEVGDEIDLEVGIYSPEHLEVWKISSNFNNIKLITSSAYKLC